MRKTFPAGFKDSRRRKENKSKKYSRVSGSSRRSRTANVINEYSVPETPPPIEEDDERTKEIKGTYILNLQQQISLLEMELDMQKKLNSEQLMKTYAGSEPLEDTMSKIKLTFIQKQKEYEDVIETLEQQVHTFEKRYEEAVHKNELLQQEKEEEVDSLLTEKEEEKNRFIAEIASKEKEIDRLEFELSNSKQFVEESLKKENQSLRNEIFELREEMVQIKNEFTEKELSLRAATSKYEKYQDETDELIRKSKYAVEQYSSLEQQVIVLRNEKKDLKNASLRHSIDIKKLELDKTEILNQKENLELKITQDYLPRLIELEKSISEEKQQNLNLIEQKEQQQNSIDELKQKASKYERTLRNFRKDHEEMRMKNDEFKLKIQHLSSELVDERNNIAKNLRIESQRLTLENKNLKLFFEKREKEVERIRINERKMMEKIASMERSEKMFKSKIEELGKFKVELIAQNNMLTKKIRAENIIRDLKSMDLPKLIKSNENMSGHVKSLLSFMQ